MLELRFLADAKRIAALRDAIARECHRSHVDPEHAALVADVTEQLIVGATPGSGKRSRRAEVFVVITVQSDSTMLMVREGNPLAIELDGYRQGLLDEHAACWSTISGTEGRTIWAEISRSAPAPAAAPVPAPAAVPAPTPVPTPPRVDGPELVPVLAPGL